MQSPAHGIVKRFAAVDDDDWCFSVREKLPTLTNRIAKPLVTAAIPVTFLAAVPATRKTSPGPIAQSFTSAASEVGDTTTEATASAPPVW